MTYDHAQFGDISKKETGDHLFLPLVVALSININYFKIYLRSSKFLNIRIIMIIKSENVILAQRFFFLKYCVRYLKISKEFEYNKN